MKKLGIYTKGQELYQASACEETGKLYLEIWKVRTIRGGWVYAVMYEKGLTWEKLSNKHFDWGWSKSIPQWCRRRCKPTASFTEIHKFSDLHTTKRQAWLDFKKIWAQIGADPEDNQNWQDVHAKVTVAIERRLKALKKSRR